MKFTSEDLMKAMGLKVGDRIRCNKLLGTVFEVIKMDNGSIALDGLQTEWHSIHELIDKDFEILPAPKRVGDLKCKEFECSSCPIRALINCNKADNNNQILFDNLAEWNSSYTSFDQEIYDILKARLDKEVEENVD